MNAQDLINAELEVKRLWEEGELPYLTHLAGSVDGKYEEWLCDFFHANIKPTDWVLASHRCHFHYLLHGGADLIEQVKRGRSMFLSGPRFISSAIVAGTASIAAGLALSIQSRGGSEKVFCFGGDGAAFHGHFMESVAMAHARKLPVTYVIEDNDSSCGVSKEQRGSPTDWKWPDCVVTVNYTPLYPHAGTANFRPQLKRQTP